MKRVVLLAVSLLFLTFGCSSVQESPEKAAPAKEKLTAPDLPIERAFTPEKQAAAQKLVENYVNALQQAIETKDFAKLQTVLPKKIDQDRAKGIFDAMLTGLNKFGKLQKVERIGILNGTWVEDYLYRFRFVRKTNSPALQEQVFEALYRIKVVCPDQKPMIIKAEFNFK